MTQNLHEVFPSYFSQSKHPSLWLTGPEISDLAYVHPEPGSNSHFGNVVQIDTRRNIKTGDFYAALPAKKSK